MNIPLANPGRLIPEERDAIDHAIKRVMESGIFIGGKFVSEFEEAFAAHHGDNFQCIGVGNGEDALTIALIALDLKSDSKVLVPANDGGFAALAVANAGFTSIPVDVSEETGLVQVPDLDAAWQQGIDALIVTHLHGALCDTKKIKEWCTARGIYLIEDCSQAHGAIDGENSAGSCGDIATYSFYPTKNLGALGDAGAIITKNQEIAKRARSLKQYGWGDRYVLQYQNGKNSRIDSLQAGVLTARLPFLLQNNLARKEILLKYQNEISGVKLLIPKSAQTVAHHAVVISNYRDQLMVELNSSGISTDIHYPKTIQEMPGLKSIERRETPQAEQLVKRQLSLPCFPTLTSPEIEYVIEKANQVIEKITEKP